MKFIFCSLLIFVSTINANIFYDLTKEEFNEVKNSRNFTGKVVLVTGSNSNIGEAIVKLFSTLGAQVVVTGRNATTVKKVGQEVEELSPNKLKPLEVVGDVTNSDDLERLVNETIKTYGKLDILVNNAAIGGFTLISGTDFMKSFDTIFNTDVRAIAQLNHLAVPFLIKTNGTIIHISSISGMAPMSGYSVYSMAKSALDMMTKCLALELGPSGVRVNTLSPGMIGSEAFRISNDPITSGIREKIAKQTPLRRIGSVLDVAKGVAFLASTDASFITGANLVIDGGLVYTPLAL